MNRPITVKIDVTKLLKQHFFKGKKGTYCTLEVWPNKTGVDEWGNSHYVKQQITKEARENGEQSPFVGDAKVPANESPSPRQQATTKPKPQDHDLDDDVPIPF